MQEMITRGRFIFTNAPGRIAIFKLVNGRLDTKEIANKLHRTPSNVLHDIKKMADLELIELKRDANGNVMKKNGRNVYEKSPLVQHVPLSYFQNTITAQKSVKKVKISKKSKSSFKNQIRLPNENEILDICKDLETQVYEFKTAGTDIRKITKEIGAFLNTSQGGIIFYGVEDDGTIVGTDKKVSELDQPLQNSVRNTISPSVSIKIKKETLFGTDILLILIDPWDKRTVYYYEKRALIRHGTNVFTATPEEIKKLHKGIPIA
ncbi:putative DNA binding domain-containing protein [archaeon]|nr:putative DNA binding domain-containing protein [archaeon]